MSFFKRLFSSDHRTALAAEAAGDFELAAERYALAGQPEAAVRMHLARAKKAQTRDAEIDALRDALHWAPEDSPMHGKASRALGQALLAQSKAEGIGTSRDRQRVVEAAKLLLDAADFEGAGDAYALIGDEQQAAAAYKQGGLVRKLEATLAKEEERNEKKRIEEQAFADYELHVRGGDRDRALEALRLCVQEASSKRDYRRLLDELEARRIESGRITLHRRGGLSLSLAALDEVSIGRDALCDLVVRTGGVSRRHALILRSEAGDGGFSIMDAGSKNGTRLGGMPIDGALPLRERGIVQLGDHLELLFEVAGSPPLLRLAVEKGLDRGLELVVAGEGQALSLEPLGVDATLHFDRGRPILDHPGRNIELNGETLSYGDVQLIRGDVLSIDGVEIEVAS